MNLVETIICNQNNNSNSFLISMDNENLTDCNVSNPHSDNDIFDTQILSQSNVNNPEINLNDLAEINYDNFDKDLKNLLNESDCTICELIQDKWSESTEQNIKYNSPVNLLNKQFLEEANETRASTPNRKGHHVKFPEEVITAFVPPKDPWLLEPVSSTTDIIQAYTNTCNKYNIPVNNTILMQLQLILNFDERYDSLNLSKIQLDWKQCEALEEIFKLVQFETIILDETKMDDESSVIFFDLIRYYESCFNLFLYNDKTLGFFGWEACGRFIQNSSTLIHFKSIKSMVCEQAVNYIQKGLKSSITLTILHLENSIKSGRMLHLLAQGAEQCKTLIELNLSDNKLGPSDGTHISYIIIQNKNLEHLDLHSNNLQDMGIYYICNVFNPTTKLKYLDVSNNELTETSATSLSSMIKISKNLQTLSLSKNAIFDVGVEILTEALTQNFTLLKLDISSTNLSCKLSIVMVMSIIDSASILNEIILTGNPIHVEVMNFLLDEMKLKESKIINIEKENSANIYSLNKLNLCNYNETTNEFGLLAVNKSEGASRTSANFNKSFHCKECAENEEKINSNIGISIVSRSNDSSISASSDIFTSNKILINQKRKK